MSKKISVITLGCSKNTVDSERLMQQISANKFTLVDDPGKADTVILNTCGFIEAAKEESIQEILKAVQMKNKGKIKEVVVAGCLSERYMDDLKKEIPEVDRYYGVEKYEEIINDMGGDLKYELLGERLLTTPSHTAYLKISEGCDNPCSFCAIPLMRGKHKSRTPESLIEEAGFLAARGVKELVIIGQDTTDYGKDLGGGRVLADLLNRLTEIPGIEWVRLMYAYPSHFPEEVMEVMANNPKICKYLDIPLQHISDKVLKSMRRGITKRRTLEVLNRLKEKVPGIAIRTTFIIGYPAETAGDFNELLEFVQEFRFDRLGVFTFSVEENTVSYLLGDPVPEEEKERRKNVIMEAQQEISAEKNQEFINTKMRVLIDSEEGEFYIGRSYRDAPEVDGEVLIKKTGGEGIKIGSFYDVMITDADEYDLYGNLI